jgi:Glycosyl transferases group 1
LFSELWRGKVKVILDAPMSEARRESGWTLPDYGMAQVFVAPDKAARLEIERMVETQDINIFSGLGAYAGVTSSMKRLANKGSARMVIITESWQSNGLIGALRALKYRYLVLRYRSRVALVLTTGDDALRQFRSAGFPEHAVVPFAYFVAGSPKPSSEGLDKTSLPRFIFVGSLVSGKRVGLLLRALSGLEEVGWHLDIVGSGPLEASLRRLASDVSISDQISWHGSMENAQAQDMIKKADVLVLPSVYDGWGAVVVEALLRGTPVIVSDAAGSSQVVTEPAMGIVVKADSLAELQKALRCMILKGPQRLDDRRSLAAECDRRMSANSGASYLAKLLTSLDTADRRPRAPWKDVSGMSMKPGESEVPSDTPHQSTQKSRTPRT